MTPHVDQTHSTLACTNLRLLAKPPASILVYGGQSGGLEKD